MLSETQRTSREKTKLGHKARYIIAIVFAAVIGLMVFLFLPNPERVTSPYVEIGDTKFPVDIADSDAERIQGLSNSASLPELTGMLFVFPEPAQQCIWMKDMNYAIDIIWLNSTGHVKDIKERVSPESYPDQFCSSDAVSYVLELPSGTVEATGISVNEYANIQL